MTADGDWRTRSACRDHDPSLWMDESRRGLRAKHIEAANICLTCPVKAECWAEVEGQPWYLEWTIRAGRYAGREGGPPVPLAQPLGIPVQRDGLYPCGTPAAFARHRYYGEEPCEACRVARNLDDQARRLTRGTG